MGSTFITKHRVRTGAAICGALALSFTLVGTLSAQDEDSGGEAPPEDAPPGVPWNPSPEEGEDPQLPIETREVTTGGGGYNSTTLSKFVPGASFAVDPGTSSDGANDLQISTGNCVRANTTSSGSSVTARSPLELPAGSRITGMIWYGADNDASNISVSLRRSAVRGVTTFFPPPISTTWSIDSSETVASMSTSGVSGTDALAAPAFTEVTGIVANGFLFGDADYQHYYLEINHNTAAGSSHLTCGVRVTYQIPSTGADQVFTPVEPCAVFDSRVSQGGTGKFAADETRTVDVIGDTTGIGGSADCGINTSATAIQVNVLLLDPNGTGSLKLWAGGGTEPAGLLAFNTDSSRWNVSAAVPVASNDTMSIKTKSTGAHVRLVATGYFSSVANMGN